MAKNYKVVDLKPRMTKRPGFDFRTERLYQVVFNAGQSMGLLLALTYTNAGTVQSAVTK